MREPTERLTAPSVERDIDLVLVTGAGASRSFGIERPFPLMAEWSEAILRKIVGAGQSVGHRQLVGLDVAADGPAFEQRLGQFLRRTQAFKELRPMLKPSLEVLGTPQQVQMLDQSQRSMLEVWYDATHAALDQLLEYLNETLFELFASPGINGPAAAAAYSAALSALGCGPGSRIVLATTNYDLVGEVALSEAGHLVDWGRPAQVLYAPDIDLRVDNLLVGVGRVVPILHLHGRLGWYASKDHPGAVRDFQVDTYNSSWGTPIVMWPDDKKDASAYEATSVINLLWDQFSVALSRAKRVFVLGHSLHDPFLVRALGLVPPGRLAVGVYAGADQDSWEREVQRISSYFAYPVNVVQCEFNETPVGLSEISQWSKKAET